MATHGISAEDWELLGFFEVEPEKLDPCEQWPFNDFVYTVRDGGLELATAIHPFHKDIRIRLLAGGTLVCDLGFVGVKDMQVIAEAGQELLEVLLAEGDRLLLAIKPSIQIRQLWREIPERA